MRLLSVNTGLPREVGWQDKIVMTGIFKEPVKGAVYLRTLNLEGDAQADLSVHGGPGEAVYAYSSEQYEFWKSELPGMSLSYGIFGENFTSEGLLEDTVNIGDRFSIGEAEVMITEPRMPCYKLGIRFGRPDMVKRFAVSRRTGFYLAVTREGKLQAGSKIELVHRDEQRVTVADITRLHLFEKEDVSTLQRALRVEALPEAWR